MAYGKHAWEDVKLQLMYGIRFYDRQKSNYGILYVTGNSDREELISEFKTLAGSRFKLMSVRKQREIVHLLI